MLTTIEQFAGKDIWVYAELDYEDAYIRVEKVFDDGTVWYNAWLPSDSYGKYDLDEILYGELTGDVDSIEIHPLDTLTTEELIAQINADGRISCCSKVTSSRRFTKYPSSYVKASSTDPVDQVQYIFGLQNTDADTYNFMCQSAYKPDGTKKYLHNEVDVTFKLVNGEPYILSGYHIGTQDFDFDEGDPWDDYVEYYQPGITDQVMERIKNNDYEYH